MSDSVSGIELIRCIYSSSATEQFTHDDITALLEKARKHNASINVTGMLLYDAGSFFQVLEGDRQVVEALYEKIAKDPLHDNVKKVIVELVEERDFSEWTMGYSGVTRQDLRNIEGLNDFFSTKRCFTELDEGRAKTLLAAFKDGRWRNTLK
ncbi:BLUF domain-containing protein [Vibrio sp. RC27]